MRQKKKNFFTFLVFLGTVLMLSGLLTMTGWTFPKVSSAQAPATIRIGNAKAIIGSARMRSWGDRKPITAATSTRIRISRLKDAKRPAKIDRTITAMSNMMLTALKSRTDTLSMVFISKYSYASEPGKSRWLRRVLNRSPMSLQS